MLTANVNEWPLWLCDDDDDDDDHVGGLQVVHVQCPTEPASSSSIPLLHQTSTSTSSMYYILTFSNIFE